MPVPLAITLLSTLGPAAAQYIGAKKAADELEIDPDDIKKQYEDLRASMPQYGVGSAWNEYLSMSKQDPAAQRERQIAAEQEATTVGALKSGGARALLGGLGAAQRQSAQNRMGVEARSQARKQSALGQYAGIQQNVNQLNAAMEQKLLSAESQALANAQNYNNQLEAAKKQALWSGLGSLAGSATSIYNSLNPPSTGVSELQRQFASDVDMGTANLLSNEVLDSEGNLMGYQMEDGSTMNPNTAGYYGAYGGFQGNNKNGGMITKGAFSHETNPIDIMQDGAKVGEMTGGEAILNPDQQKKVAKQSPYFRKLMREFAMRNRK